MVQWSVYNYQVTFTRIKRVGFGLNHSQVYKSVNNTFRTTRQVCTISCLHWTSATFRTKVKLVAGHRVCVSVRKCASTVFIRANSDNNANGHFLQVTRNQHLVQNNKSFYWPGKYYNIAHQFVSQSQSCIPTSLW